MRRNPAKRPGVDAMVIPRWYRRDHNFIAELMDALQLNINFRKGMSVKDAMAASNLGHIEVDASGEFCHNTRTGAQGAEIHFAGATGGWGPLLYDFAALISTNVYGFPLVSDREHLSPAAERVWEHYKHRRPDVPKTDLSTGPWRCDPQGSGEGLPPMFGITMPRPVFEAAWNTDPQLWLDNAKFRAWEGRARSEERLRKGKKNPRRALRNAGTTDTLDGLKAAARRVETLLQAQRLYRLLGVRLSDPTSRLPKSVRQEAKYIRRDLEAAWGGGVRGKTSFTYRRWESGRGRGEGDWKTVVAPAEMRGHLTVKKGTQSPLPLLPVIYDKVTGEPVAVFDRSGGFSAALMELLRRDPEAIDLVKAEIQQAQNAYQRYLNRKKREETPGSA